MAKTVTQSRPRNLHISHSWGGGVDRWVQDFCRHDHTSDNLVLENVGTENCYGLGLRLVDGRSRQEVDAWYHRDPISETRIHHPGYRDILAAIVSEHEISHIYLSCLIGHTLDVFDLDIPVTKIHHDFYPYCPNIYIYFGGICERCDEERVCACLDANPVNFANHKSSVGYWMDLRRAYTEALCSPHVTHVFPSASTFGHLSARQECFAELDHHVIAHGINMRKQDSFGGAEPGRRLRVVVMGTQNIVKGSELLRQAFDHARLVADFTFLGGGVEGRDYASRFGVRYVEHYQHNTLSSLLRDGRFDLSLFASLFPETFCYTLSEAWAHCVPACARKVGSFLDRIEDGKNGFLLGSDSDALVDFLLHIGSNREELRQVSTLLREMPVRTVQEMVLDYYRLRDDVGQLWSVQSSTQRDASSGRIHADEGFDE